MKKHPNHTSNLGLGLPKGFNVAQEQHISVQVDEPCCGRWFLRFGGGRGQSASSSRLISHQKSLKFGAFQRSSKNEEGKQHEKEPEMQKSVPPSPQNLSDTLVL